MGCHNWTIQLAVNISLENLTLACQQISKQLSEEYERIVNPEKATEDTKPVKIKEEPVSDIAFPVSEELEVDLASGDQSLPMGVLGAQSERFPSNLEVEASPQASSKRINLLTLVLGDLPISVLFVFWNQALKMEE